MKVSKLAGQNTSKGMEEFDAVYPFNGGDTWELEQSIRLIRKNVKGLRHIYTIGIDSGLDVIHIPYIEEDAKEINIWKKTCAACFIPDISDTFLFINDDHFVIQEIDMFLNYMYGGRIDEIVSGGQYQNAVNRTLYELKKRCLDIKNFDIHCPMFIEKSKFMEVFNEFGVDNELLMKSCYCNYHKIEGGEMPDLKFRWLATKNEIEKECEGRWVLSTHEHLISYDLRVFIESK